MNYVRELSRLLREQIILNEIFEQTHDHIQSQHFALKKPWMHARLLHSSRPIRLMCLEQRAFGFYSCESHSKFLAMSTAAYHSPYIY